MKVSYKIALFLWVVILVYAPCGCSLKVAVNERDMSKIISEIYLADRWVKSYDTLSQKADTTLLYGAIFQKYGYTLEDYYSSMAYYVTKPKKYSKIFESAYDILYQGLKAARWEVELEDFNKDSIEVLPPLNLGDTLYNKWWVYSEKILHRGAIDSLKVPYRPNYKASEASFKGRPALKVRDNSLDHKWLKPAKKN